MGSSSQHPTRPTVAPATFVVALHFARLHRGFAGPFSSSEAAEVWVHDLIGDDRGWTWSIEPVAPPQALPLASERRSAQRAQRRHLRVLR